MIWGVRMLVADTHVHSDYSIDAEDKITKMCESAIAKGVSIICFTEHIDMNSEDESCDYFDAEKYLQAIEEARNKFQEKIIILSGIEFSEPHLYPDKFKKVLASGYDSVLGSIYWSDDRFISDDELRKGYSSEEIFDKYYNSVLKMVEYGGFNILSHLDYPKKYNVQEYKNNSIIEKILNLIIEKDIALEINTSSLRKDVDDIMPESEILAIYSNLGGKKVTIGSDAHRYNEVASDFNYALKIIDKYGFDNGYYVDGIFEYLWL